MPTLLEVQRAMRASLVDRNDDAVAAMLPQGIGADRLNIYRNTFLVGLTKALSLCFPRSGGWSAPISSKAQPPSSFPNTHRAPRGSTAMVPSFRISYSISRPLRRSPISPTWRASSGR
jgi:hypothetical protein